MPHLAMHRHDPAISLTVGHTSQSGHIPLSGRLATSPLERLQSGHMSVILRFSTDRTVCNKRSETDMSDKKDKKDKQDNSDLVDESGFYVYNTPKHLKQRFNDNLIILELQSKKDNNS